MLYRSLLVGIVFVWLSSPVWAQCDDDDDSPGRFFRQDFEMVQESVFGVLDGVRVGRTASGRIVESTIRGGLDRCQADGLDTRDQANVTVVDSSISGNDDGMKIKTLSRVTIESGVVNGLDDGVSVADEASVEIRGGVITGNTRGMQLIDWARAAVRGGTVNGPVFTNDQSQLTISGGTIGPIQTFGTSITNVMGGTINHVIEAHDQSRVNVFLKNPDDRRTLFDGSPITFQSFGYDGGRISFLETITGNRTINSSPSSVRDFGVLDLAETPPLVEVTEGARIGHLYLSGRSRGNLRSGELLDSVVADDASEITVSGSTIRGDYFSIRTLGDSRLFFEDGSAFSRKSIHALGRSRVTIAGGEIRGGENGIDAQSKATVQILGGHIESAFEEAVRMRDDTQVDMSDGIVQGRTAGFSASERTNLTIRGGTIRGARAVRARDRSNVMISGGTFHGNILLEDRTIVEFDGGEFDQDAVLTDFSMTTIRDGTFQDDIRMSDNSRLTVLGGNFAGTLQTFDDADAFVAGGTFVDSIRAGDRSRIRIVGHDLRMADTELTGRLIDGGLIKASLDTDDQASIEFFEGLSERQTYDIVTPPERKLAIVSLMDRDIAVDMTDGAEASEVYVIRNGRLNYFGGKINGFITVEDGWAHVYGSSLERGSLTPDENGFERFTVTGITHDGKSLEVPFRSTHHGSVLFYETVTTDTTFDSANVESNLAIMDGPSGTTTVDLVSGRFRDVETWGTSQLNVHDGTQRVAGTLNAWQSSHIVVDGGAIRGGSEGIKALDTSRVTINGGEIKGSRDAIRVWNESSLHMRGGTLMGFDDGIDLNDSATAIIRSGNVEGRNDGIKAKSESVLSVLGGNITGRDDGISVANNGFARVSAIDTSTAILGMSNGIHTVDNAEVEVYSGMISGTTFSLLAENDSTITLFGGELDGPIHVDGATVRIIGSFDLIQSEEMIEGHLLNGDAIRIPVSLDNRGKLELIQSVYGDANLDGRFDSQDLVVTFQAAEYEDDIPFNSTWAEGDWNGDGDFSSADLVLAFRNSPFEQPPGVANVPEPPAALLPLWLGALGFLLRTRHNRSHS